MAGLGLKMIAGPDSPICGGCLHRDWELHYTCDGIGCPLGVKQDWSANYLSEHYHYRCRFCGRSHASRTNYPDL